MRLFYLTLFFTLCITKIYAQLEVMTGYAVNKNLADGMPIQISYDFKIKNKFFTKSQIGYKYLYHYNDWVGAKLKVSIIELHQTFSYEVIKKNKYILKPNIGINYRYYKWKGKMLEPYNTLPQRAMILGFRDDRLVLNSYDNGYTDEYSVSNFGFTIQLQNQFRINDNIWLSITPFVEPDYDHSQNTGGCYVGVVFKQL